MADILLTEQSAPANLSSGTGAIFIDSSASLLCFKDDAGRVAAWATNAAIASQGPGFAVDTYVTNSDLIVPSFGLQAKAYFLWRISASKTNAGVAGPIYVIRTGTGKAVTDTSRATVTGPAQTAIPDIGTLMVMATLRNVGASGVMQVTAWWEHRGTAVNTTTSGTGFANDTTGHVEGSGTFDTAAVTAGHFIGLSINGGLNAAWTVTQAHAEASW